ncbi:MAG: trypsin-like serine protease, partial [bacterium]|nr:trypsin-like serine protease [bacterium]
MLPAERLRRCQFMAQKVESRFVYYSQCRQSRSRSMGLSLLAVVMVIFVGAGGAPAIVTSDISGSHVLDDNVPLDVGSSTGWCDVEVPDIDHDSVVQLRFFRPDYGDTFCSAALVNTPLGPGALSAAHCVADDTGQIVAEDFSFEVYDVFGTLHIFTTSDPDNVKVHPNYDGVAWHGYDLALVFVDQPLSVFFTKYDVWDSGYLPGPLHSVVKMGFGRKGWGGDGNTELDELKRWGLAHHEAFGLGDYGVPPPAGGGWNNTDTQMTLDFDDGSLIVHNGFNFYGNFLPGGGIVMPTKFQNPCRRGGTIGYDYDEVMGSSGDSGGPNFAYDEFAGQWRIVAVNSYVFRIPENWGGFTGTSD